MLAGLGSGPKLPIGTPGVCMVSLEREKETPLLLSLLPATVWLMFTCLGVLREGYREEPVGNL